MTPDRSRAARQRQIAQQLWLDYLQAGDFFQFDRWLATAFKQHSRFGKRDRALYREWLFAALRFGELAAQILAAGSAPVLTSIAATAQTGLRADQWRQLDQDAFFALVEARYHLETPETQALLPQPEMLSDALAASLTAVRLATEQGSLPALLLWHGIPQDYLPLLQARAEASHWTEQQLQQWLTQQSRRPPVWIRINHPNRRAEILDELGEQVVAVEGEALALEVQGSLNRFQCVQQGWLEVQDLASQALGASVACRPGDSVWDACAGGGGKTLQIAAQLQQQGRLLASDIRGHKLKELEARAQRAGFNNLQTLRWDGSGLPTFPNGVSDGFDWVLVDAPCSSSGTWRRSPDVKLREAGRDLAELTALQRRLLLQAAQAVKPGGHLVYGTCSFRVEENEAIVASLLQQPGWRLERQTLLGCPRIDADTLFVAHISLQA